MRRLVLLALLALFLVPAAEAALLADITRRYEAGVSGYVDFALVQAGQELPCNDTTVLCFTIPATDRVTVHVRDDTGFWGSALVRWGDETDALDVVCGARGVAGPVTTHLVVYAGPATCTNAVPNPFVTTTGTVRILVWD